jgi:hypothetical protein
MVPRLGTHDDPRRRIRGSFAFGREVGETEGRRPQLRYG